MFLVKRGAVVNRLEPKFYLPKYLNNEQQVEQSIFPKYPLRAVTEIISDGTHFTPQYMPQGVKFLSVKDVRPFQIDYENSKFISLEEANTLDRRCKPQQGDVLLTKIGATFGFAASIQSTERFQIFVSVALLRPKRNLIESEYLALCLNTHLTYLQCERVIKGAGVPDLHLEDIRKVRIALPPIEVQQKITQHFHHAYQNAKTKEAEARALLESIDGYVLSELGITLPEKQREMVYRVPFSRVRGGRFDPLFAHQMELYTDIILKIPVMKLSSLVVLPPEYGAGETATDGNPLTDVRYIRITDIDEFGNLKSDDWKTASTINERYYLQHNDLLFARTGATVGKTFLYQEKNGKAIFAGYMIRFRLNGQKIKPEYAFTYTQTSLYRWWIRIIQRTSAQPNINAEEYKSLLIPLPPLDVQERIAAEAQARRERAKALEQEAAALLQAAKREVERMIVGEGA